MIISKLLSPHKWRHMARTILQDASQLGLGAATKLIVSQAQTILAKDLRVLSPGGIRHIHPASLLHPLYFRALSSDVYVIRQVLVEEEYACLKDLGAVRFIVDCGANIGCSSAYFLSQFPNARLIAIEPDEDNFKMLERNLAPYGVRARALRAAVWADGGQRLRCVRGEYRDGLDWSCTVVADGSGDTVGVTISELLDTSGEQDIDLLKIDIEGAERYILAPGRTGWLARVRDLCIELHGAECEEAFAAAIRPYSCTLSRSGELTMCRGICGPAALLGGGRA
jgi:FkbM family methyltransferase